VGAAEALRFCMLNRILSVEVAEAVRLWSAVPGRELAAKVGAEVLRAKAALSAAQDQSGSLLVANHALASNLEQQAARAAELAETTALLEEQLLAANARVEEQSRTLQTVRYHL
jgi:hypothetical protein